MSATRGWLVGVAAALLLPAVPAQADEASERARIGRERAEAQARFEQRQRECAQRFAITPCVEEARAEHRQTMIQLRRQEGVLDEAQRKQRAAARLAAIEEKQRAEAQRSPVPRASQPVAPMQVRPPRAPASAPRAAAAPASAADAAQKEQRKRAQFEARQREAKAHREESQRRRAERAAAGKASAPLPDPAAR